MQLGTGCQQAPEPDGRNFKERDELIPRTGLQNLGSMLHLRPAPDEQRSQQPNRSFHPSPKAREKTKWTYLTKSPANPEMWFRPAEPNRRGRAATPPRKGTTPSPVQPPATSPVAPATRHHTNRRHHLQRPDFRRGTVCDHDPRGASIPHQWAPASRVDQPERGDERPAERGQWPGALTPPPPAAAYSGSSELRKCSRRAPEGGD